MDSSKAEYSSDKSKEKSKIISTGGKSTTIMDSSKTEYNSDKSREKSKIIFSGEISTSIMDSSKTEYSSDKNKAKAKIISTSENSTCIMNSSKAGRFRQTSILDYFSPIKNSTNVLPLISSIKYNANKKEMKEISCKSCTYMKDSEMFTFTNLPSSSSYSIDISKLLKNNNFVNTFKNFIKKNSSAFPHIETKVIFKKLTTDEYLQVYFHINNQLPLSCLSELEYYLQELFNSLKIQISDYEGRGSDLIYIHIDTLIVKMKKYSPGTGCSYIPLPKHLTNTKGYLNIKNTNNECFKYAVTAALYPCNKNAERPRPYERHFEKINWKGLEFPLEIKKINFQKFEKNNPSIPPVNIHIYKDKDTLPIPFYISFKFNESVSANSENAINLLYFQSETEASSPGHFVFIKNLSRAFAKLTKHKNLTFPCVNCYGCFANREKLNEHSRFCLRGNPQIKKISPRDVYFNKFYTKQEIPVMMICDTEAYNEKNNQKNNVLSVQKCSGYYIYFLVAEKYKNVFPEYTNKHITYTGPDASKHFLENIIHHGKIIGNKIKNTNVPMSKTPKVTCCKVKKGIPCHICEKKICEKCEKEQKCECLVRDHDHLTGEFRGWAHYNCNLGYNLVGKSIPIIFHNFKGYDCKLFIKELGSFKDVEYYPIVENSEKFKCMKMKFNDVSVMFIDSLAHLSSSLDKLTQNLANYSSTEISFTEFIQKQDIKQLRQLFPSVSQSFPSDKQFKLIVRKGVFPYDYFTSLDVLNKTELLKREDFYSVLNDEHISEEDYEFYLTINKEFKFKTFREYYDLYLKLDTLLLADICQSYKNTSLKIYGLDPFHFVSAPSLAWQAALKYTGIKLKQLNDLDMHDFIKQGIRGGVSYVARKYSEANNIYMQEYDNTKESTFINYTDANNLYGWAMLQSLPVGGFKWVETTTLFPIKKNQGHIYEVDLEYPEDLHNFHNDFPLAPDKMTHENQTKLIPHFHPRKNYVVDDMNLDFYLKNGLKLTKIHRCLRYTKKPLKSTPN